MLKSFANGSIFKMNVECCFSICLYCWWVFFFFDCPYTLGVRFGRVFARWEAQSTQLVHVSVSQGDDTTHVHFAMYRAWTFGIHLTWDIARESNRAWIWSLITVYAPHGIDRPQSTPRKFIRWRWTRTYTPAAQTQQPRPLGHHCP